MIQYKDFGPKRLRMEGLTTTAKFIQKFKGKGFETIEDKLDRLNGWAMETEVDVINIETVFYHTLRVWYRTLPS